MLNILIFGFTSLLIATTAVVVGCSRILFIFCLMIFGVLSMARTTKGKERRKRRRRKRRRRRKAKRMNESATVRRSTTGSELKGRHSSQRPKVDSHTDFRVSGLETDVAVTGMYRAIASRNSARRHLDGGRLDINVCRHTSRPRDIVKRKYRRAGPLPTHDGAPKAVPVDPERFSLHLNIVIQVIGSRGDIQPFIALGNELRRHGHRVRLATHETFRDSVSNAGLEFFNIGGDPTELMAFMVKNPGIRDILRSGVIQRRRREMRAIFSGCWRSCFETGDERDPFVADAIIANPPSFAHLSCAERMGVPLNMMFTMPWSATRSFAHPLVKVRAQNAEPSNTNLVSYTAAEVWLWEGIGDLINRLRKEELGLDPLDSVNAPGLLDRLQIPYTYLWSPELLPKPRDWSDNIDICGFQFLAEALDYTPPEDLVAFLEDGDPPIYIGFGSIVVENPSKLTNILFDAVCETGQRALISTGWAGLGSEVLEIPRNIFLLDQCPHDWLFPRVSCVIHHGGAGTTATGLLFGRPTIIVPFFGDQAFWGSIVARAGAGPDPIPYGQLSSEGLANAIGKALDPRTKSICEEIGRAISREDGVKNAVRSFYRDLDPAKLRCAICPNRPAVWWVRDCGFQLSAFAASVLRDEGHIGPGRLELYRSQEYDTGRDPREPLSALVDVFYALVIDIINLIAVTPVQMIEGSRRNPPKQNHSLSQRVRKSTKSPGQSAGNEKTGRLADIKAFCTEKNSMKFIPKAERRVTRLTKHALNFVIVLPADLTLSLTKGYHNAPRLYHDTTVREPHRVTGIKSGFRAARKEFTQGFYDGVSGLIRQPAEGFRSSGSSGLIKGIAKGLGGAVLKPAAGAMGLLEFPLDGLHKSVRKSLSECKSKEIVLLRTQQGDKEARQASREDRERVIRTWQELERHSPRNRRVKWK
ncbi:hypothetical protein BDV23DRAFT_143537 [Aspergillus alliaceus]|uniref:Uncharacterized protein n=1 Tax=Petromyces alliaceus TaxID=209559 RepID=A0A5N7CPS1_PETAA|nr:hypothetical protein BDV23DRAFT_143537 [Aspergillus alliaceus]